MTKRKVWRYKCDFCKKSGCSGWHIQRHETGCTANPNRECGICKLIGNEQQPMADLVATLAGATDETIAEKVDALRSLCDGCHACMLAAIRQSGLLRGFGEEGYFAIPFSYTEAREEFWKTRHYEECG